MVATVVLDGTKIANGDDIGVETWGVTRWRGSGQAPSADQSGDVFLEGTDAVLTRSNNSRVWLWFDIGASNEFDYTPSTGAQKGEHVSIQFNMLAAGLLQLSTYVSGSDRGGVGIALGSSTTDVREWNFGGKDTYQGGWKNLTIDPTKTPSNERGTFDISSVRYFGIWVDTSTAAKFDNFVVDSIVSGFGLRVYGTSTTDDVFGDILAADEGTTNNKYGVVRSDNEVIYVKGQLLFGDNVGTNASTLTSTDRIVVYEMQEYYTSGGSWVTAVSSIFNFIKRVGNSTNGTDLTLGDGTAIQAGASLVSGNSPIVSIDLDDEHTGAGADLTINGARFSGIVGSFNLSLNGAHTMDSTTINDCIQITGAGDGSDGIVIRECIFQNYSGEDAALLWGDGVGNDAGMDIQSSLFRDNNGGTDSGAIEFSDQGSSPFTFVDMLFDNNDWDIVLSHASESITISATGTSNPTSKDERGSGAIIINNEKSLTISNIKTDSQVVILDAADNSELDAVENSGTTFVYAYNFGTDPTNIVIAIDHIDWVYLRFAYSVTADDVTLPVQQQTERNYKT